MAANTSDRAVIGFVKDYDERELREKVDYQVTDGGVKSHLSVGISYGDSTEYFFLKLQINWKKSETQRQGVGPRRKDSRS